MLAKRTTPLDAERLKRARAGRVHRLQGARLVARNQLPVGVQLGLGLVIGVRSP